MKKVVSRMMAMFLAVLMVMSCGVTVFASTEVDAAKKGSISLTKSDITDGKKVEGATFKAYRILDFDGATYTVNENFVGQVEVSDIVNTSASQEGTLSYGSTNELEAQISKIQSYIKTNSIEAAASATTDASGALKLADLNLGVYLVQETAVPAGYIASTQAFLVAIPSWDQSANDGEGEWIYDITAKPKDEYLQVDKEIKDVNQGTAENGTDEDSYSIGDVIPYTVTAKIPNYGMSADYPELTVTENLLLHEQNGQGITKYNALNLEFTDTLTKGLTLDLDSLEIKILNADGTEATTLTKGETLAELASFTTTGEGEAERVDAKTPVADGGDYTATKTNNDDDSTTMAIEVAWNSVDRYQGYTIQLKYNARLNEDAAVGSENKNTVEYKFSNDPQNATGDPEDPTRTGTTDENKVYTYEMDLTKMFNGKDADTAGVDASAVEFELYVKNEDGTTTQLSVIETGKGEYTIWTGDEDDVEGEVVTTLNPSSTGSLIVKGFEAGTYELKETKSVAGYTVLTEPVTILVEEVKEGDPEVVTQKVSAYTLKYKETDTDGKVVVEKADTLADKNAEGKFTITVNNAKNQFNLPTTGGLGLWMFTIAGGVLMAAAIIFFSVLRKKKGKRS